MFENTLGLLVYAVGATCIDNTVDYCALDSVVENALQPKVDALTGWQSYFTKWRLSNATNKTDAGLFHRDNKFLSEVKDIYTVLVYVDGGTIELLPGSHLQAKRSVWESVKHHKDITRLKIKPGDLLIIHSNILHRGIFFEQKVDNRRLLQIFQVYPSIEAYNETKGGVYTIIRQTCEGFKCAGMYTNAWLLQFSFYRYMVSYLVYLFASMRNWLAHPGQTVSRQALHRKIMYTTEPSVRYEGPSCKQSDNMYYIKR